MFTKIVVAVDGSEHSNSALDYAKTLAECFNSTLWLVHVFPHTLEILSRDQYRKLIAKRKAAGQEVLDQARQLLDNDSLDVREELLEGPAAEAIINVAETREADLIIMGTRGFSALQGLLLGSVSQKVIHHAYCPVMVVR